MGMDGGKFKPGAAQLILSGSALTVFLVIHVKQFRLGHAEVSGDVYTLARQTLADPKMAAGYCSAVAALGFHLWKGWGSVTFSLKLDSQHFANVLIIGRVVVCLQMRLPRPSSIRVLKLQLNTCVWCGALSRQCLTVCGSCTLANKHQLSARLHCRMASLLTCLIMH